MLVGFFCLLLAVVSAFSQAVVPKQCADQTPSCKEWAANGFCTSPFYASMKSSCPLTCGLCNEGDALPCEDKNVSNCINWVINGFCNSTLYSTAQKIEYCAASCGLCNEVING